VLAGSEMTEAAVVYPSDVRELAQLPRRQRAVRHVHAQHVRVKLQVDAVLQPQRLELILGDLAREAPLDLTAKLRDALGNEPMVEFIVTIHPPLLRLPARQWSARTRESPRGSPRAAAYPRRRR